MKRLGLYAAALAAAWLALAAPQLVQAQIVTGTPRLATQAEAQAGTSNTVVLSPLRATQHADAWLAKGVTSTKATAPSANIETWFGGSYKTDWHLFANDNSTHSLAAGDAADSAWWSAAIIHNFKGSGGASGAPRLDGALWLEAAKNGWNDAHTVGTGEKGPVTTLFVVAANNEFSDTATIVANASKIYGDTLTTNTTGSVLQYEGTTRAYDDADGTTIDRDIHVLLGWDQNPTFTASTALHPGKQSGVYVEAFKGSPFAAFVSDGGGSSGGSGMENILVASTDRNAANIFFQITGSGDVTAGGGKVRAATGSAAFPSFSFIGDTDTGIYNIGGNQIGFATTGIVRLSIIGSGNITSTLPIFAPAFRTTTALVTATDGGSTASFTANMVGATGGPTTAAQNGWVKMQDSAGATIWLPVWK